MSAQPPAGNDHIRSNPEAFRTAYEHARQQLGKLKGVVGVAFGLKATGKAFTNDIAILVYVLEKKPNGSLAADQQIPPVFEGYRTDVRIFTPAKATIAKCNDDGAYADIHGGIQIEAWGAATPKNMASSGTLGCIVRRRGSADPDNVYLLTNHHVLLKDDIKTKPNDGVYQPYKPRTIGTKVFSGSLLGRISKDDVYAGHVNTNGFPVDSPPMDPPPQLETIPATFDGFYVDAAAVHLDLASYCFGAKCPTGDTNLTWSPTIPNLNLPVPLQPPLQPTDRDHVTDVRDIRTDQSVFGAQVFKVGRTTAWTKGLITGINVPAHDVISITDPNTNIKENIVVEFRYNVIELVLDPSTPNQLNCIGTYAFAGPGDSGSLVVDGENRAIGLFFANGPVPNQTGAYLSYASFIVPVLDVLNLYIQTTTGTSHGAANATDGSGAGAATGNQTAASTPGVIPVSYKRAVRGAGAVASPIDLTDGQQTHVLAIREELMATPRGAQLYSSFVELRREIAYLVRSCRPVTVTWHRNKGPAFVASMINYLRGDAPTIPTQIDGVSRAQLLSKMCDVLAVHGSNPLRLAIERHRADLALFANGATMHDIIGALREAEHAGVDA